MMHFNEVFDRVVGHNLRHQARDRALVFTVSPGFMVGGLADRLFGLCSAFVIADSLEIPLFIDFCQPFDFFRIFSPHLRRLFDWGSNQGRFQARKFLLNMIDQRYARESVRMATELFGNQQKGVLLLAANDLRPDVLLGDEQVFQVEEFFRSFASIMLRPDYSLFDPGWQALHRLLGKNRVLGVHVRTGGGGDNCITWGDPSFSPPRAETVAGAVLQRQGEFDAVFIASDSTEYRDRLFKLLSRNCPTLFLNDRTFHVERSVGSDADDGSRIVRSVGDHTLLRACGAGILASGGRYALSAAYAEGHQVLGL